MKVVGETTMLPKLYTAHFKSVIVFGKIRRLQAPEITKAVYLLCEKNMPDYMASTNSKLTVYIILRSQIDVYLWETVYN